MGWSERPTAPRRMADRIEDLNRLTEALEIDRSGRGRRPRLGWPDRSGLGAGASGSAGRGGSHQHRRGAARAANGTQPAPGLIRLARSAALRQTVCVSTPAFVRGARRCPDPPCPTRCGRRWRRRTRTADRRRSIGDFVADIPLEPDHPSRVALDRVAGGLAELREVPSPVALGAEGPGLLRALPERSVPAVAPRLHPAVRAGLASGHRGRSGNGRARVALGRGSAGGCDEQSGGFRQRGPDAEPLGSATVDDTPNPSGPALSARAGDRAVAAVEISAQGTLVTSFAELEQRVADLAVGLAEAGVRPGRAGRPPRPAGTRPDGRGVRLLAGRCGDRPRRRRTGGAQPGSGVAQRRAGPPHRHPRRACSPSPRSGCRGSGSWPAPCRPRRGDRWGSNTRWTSWPRWARSRSTGSGRDAGSSGHER